MVESTGAQAAVTAAPLQTMIGLETHVQLQSKGKLFCTCPANYREALPNHNVCAVCSGQPGSKPSAVNRSAIENAVKIALALGATIQVDEPILVQRKHYLYPDLPSGFQRTSKPLSVGGELSGVHLREIHFEEDPGQFELREGTVDFNRSGIPLLEIVTEPEFRDPQHAREFLEELGAILNYLSAGRQEPGSMRVDANLSVVGFNRVEVKNINSFKGVFTALSFEAARQKNLVKNKMAIAQETRHFDEGRGTTATLRRKETADDYRYFPDPDVPPVRITNELVERLRKELPELPMQKRERFANQYGILPEEAFAITLEKKCADAFEAVAKSVSPPLAANFFRGVLRKQLNYRSLSFEESKLAPATLVELLALLERKEITEKVGEQVLIAVLEKHVSPRAYAGHENLLGVSKEGDLQEIVEKVIASHSKPVADFKAGKEESMHFLAGLVMKETRGKADPGTVQELLRKRLTQ